MFMETSAKAAYNVKTLFKKIAMSLPGMEEKKQDPPNSGKRYHSHLCAIKYRRLNSICHFPFDFLLVQQ